MVMHFDVWGLSKVTTLGGLPWFVTFLDDCIRITCVCLMKSKGEVNLLFQNFHKMLHTQYNTQVQILCSDNGGEYTSFEFQQYLDAHRIIYQTIYPNTPQKNGVAE